MRKLVLAAVALVVSLLAVGLQPMVASALDTSVTVWTRLDRSNPDHLLTIYVAVQSPTDITRVHAALRYPDENSDPYATVDDFTLVDGTPRDGDWRAEYQPVVFEDHPGRNWVTAEAVDVNGVTRSSTVAAGFNSCYTSEFQDLVVSPSVVDADHRELTVTGRLVYTSYEGSPPQPAAGASIDMTWADEPVTTDEQGEFEISGYLGHAYASVGHDEYDLVRDVYCSAYQNLHFGVHRQETQISGHIVTPQPVNPGTQVTATGTLVRLSPDGPVPVPDKRVYVLCPLVATCERGWATTGADGSFTRTFTAQGAGSVLADFFADDYGPFLQDSDDVLGHVDARWRTQMKGYNAAPEPVALHGWVHGKGRLFWYDKDGLAHPLAGVELVYEFSRNGKTGWTRGPYWSMTTGENGYFSFSEYVQRDGYWRARLPGDSDTYRPWTSRADFVDARYRTRITSFNAAPEPVRRGHTITVTGHLDHHTTRWTALAHRPVSIYFRTSSAHPWTYLGRDATGTHGNFHKTFTAKRDGNWQARFAGGTSNLATTSRGDHVDVRR